MQKDDRWEKVSTKNVSGFIAQKQIQTLPRGHKIPGHIQENP
jgi:hypothetical protein